MRCDKAADGGGDPHTDIDEEDDSFERIGTLNQLEVSNKEQKDRIATLEKELAEARLQNELHQKTRTGVWRIASMDGALVFIWLIFTIGCALIIAAFVPRPPAQGCCPAPPPECPAPDGLQEYHCHEFTSSFGIDRTDSIVWPFTYGFKLTGHFVSEVTEGSKADIDGKLAVGDELLSVDGVDVQGKDEDDVYNLIWLPKIWFQRKLGLMTEVHWTKCNPTWRLNIVARRNVGGLKRMLAASEASYNSGIRMGIFFAALFWLIFPRNLESRIYLADIKEMSLATLKRLENEDAMEKIAMLEAEKRWEEQRKRSEEVSANWECGCWG